MKICRYNENKLGLVDGDQVYDVTDALNELPPLRWPVPLGDCLVEHLEMLRPVIMKLAENTISIPLKQVKLRSPVANPSKIIGAPINYQAHINESKADQEIAHGRDIKHVSNWGLFLKANSALVGPSEGVALRFTDRRNDHEIELAVVIGKQGTNIAYDQALDFIAGYAMGLDMTVRGTEVASFRKSIDTYAVLGPWLVTADEISDPNQLDFSLSVNGEIRQNSNTRNLVYNVNKLIEYASSVYTLYPGDIIMTGTPEGVSPVQEGDLMRGEMEGIGAMEMAVRAA